MKSQGNHAAATLPLHSTSRTHLKPALVHSCAVECEHVEQAFRPSRVLQRRRSSHPSRPHVAGGRLQRPLWRRLGCHGTRYVHNTRGWYAYSVRGALGASRPVRPVRTQRGRLVRVARTYPTEAPGRTCQLRTAQVCLSLSAPRAPRRVPRVRIRVRVRVRARVRVRVRVRVRNRVTLTLTRASSRCSSYLGLGFP